MKRFDHNFEELISIENLLLAWQEFLRGKKSKKDVQEFQLHLMDNILALHRDLSNGTYKHSGYRRRNINDPKPRVIHIPMVRDRLIHHTVYRKLYPFFDRAFIADSFSCRDFKGTHKAAKKFLNFAQIVSKNNTQTCWVLKCDVRKFFASIDQEVLINILDEKISDKRIVGLLKEIIGSFPAGLPLGNLTSQLFCNIYMNEFDQFVKHGLKIDHYIRYADDFVILSPNKEELESLIPMIADFLQESLKLELHPDKVFIKRISAGVDFLGWVHFTDHRVLRNTTKKRMMKKLNVKNISSYVGLIKHGNSYKIRENLLKTYETQK